MIRWMDLHLLGFGAGSIPDRVAKNVPYVFPLLVGRSVGCMCSLS
jgi:hypothetical protein